MVNLGKPNLLMLGGFALVAGLLIFCVLELDRRLAEVESTTIRIMPPKKPCNCKEKDVSDIAKASAQMVIDVESRESDRRSAA